ncbi:hypothetical protein JT327_gp18 [Aeromonas phage LAh_7]|uniref:Uncharacterized protein n=1 Tax=Aeromonas phage LAh_7 TaxID=2591031 RepID=A0A514A0B4_9CAUD|nr:hypothetical protein JT327_gp18 [Aeromonas phage LAh_7]QDH46714.1 hypothetical protein LAh7_18 [Aeromonas phage LAh_7]
MATSPTLTRMGSGRAAPRANRNPFSICPAGFSLPGFQSKPALQLFPESPASGFQPARSPK